MLFPQVLASANPDKYAWLYQWSDEVYLVLIATLQNYYLKNYCKLKNLFYFVYNEFGSNEMILVH